MGRFPSIWAYLRPINMLLALSLGPRIEDVLGLGLLDLGLFLGRRAASGRPGQEQAADGENREAGDVAANRRHR
jgi:hypothetical protein